MRRLVSLTLAALVIAGCGEDADPVERDRFTGAEAGSPAERPGDAPNTGVTTLTEFEALLEGAGLDLVRTGGATAGGEGLGPDVEQPYLSRVRYAENTATGEFGTIVFGDVATAREAARDLRDAEVVENGGRVVRGCNVVAVYEPRMVGGALARRVTAVLRSIDCPR